MPTEEEINAEVEAQLEAKRQADELKATLNEKQAEAFDKKKESLLAKAGYDAGQVERYKALLKGETEADVKAEVQALQDDLPPKQNYGDPNVGNNAKTPPKKKNHEDKGRENYKRLVQKGKLRGGKRRWKND
ncbi:hypothetical protein [Salimicrobium flavidum]|uniref:Scaffolding protein n=1 Tax=Salimicrobium flavidum TaxID=570947 RepID=A0A1N7JXA8_9BACI|nr:hypothetical protein [Salimicrobium flavidum]SIS53985.1 hypothetical protein SAMN05421687_10823 [Salimicrobium flavidum]